MSTHVVVEGGDIEAALCLFQRKLDRENSRPWYKRRFGYYEKPSALRRKRRKSKNLHGGKGTRPVYPGPKANEYKWYVGPPSHPDVGDVEQWERTGPTNMVGRRGYSHLTAFFKMQMHRRIIVKRATRRHRIKSKKHWKAQCLAFGYPIYNTPWKNDGI